MKALTAVGEGVEGAVALLREGNLVLIAGLIAYLAFDVMIVWATFRALGPAPPMAILWIAYLIGELGGLIPVPGGIGGVDAGLVGTLALYNVSLASAAGAVLAYRAIALWVPAVIGGVAFLRCAARCATRRERDRRVRAAERDRADRSRPRDDRRLDPDPGLAVVTPAGDGTMTQRGMMPRTTGRGGRRGKSERKGRAHGEISRYEQEQIEQANATGRAPVVFIHGLWLLPSSWDRWATVFEEAGYAPLTPGWPDDPQTVEEANAHPEVFAHKTVGQVADHFAEVIGKLQRKPAVIGHSFGGLLTQIVAGRGLSAASVAIDPAPFRGVLPLPISALKSASPVLGNPANRNRAVPLTYEQFRFAFANAVSEDEAKELYDDVRRAGLRACRCSRRRPPTSTRGPRRRSTAKNPDRGPLLIISGEKDNTVPWAIANASFKKQKRNEGVTEIVEMPNRGHALTIDSGWREVADTALEFVKRFA